MKPSIPALRRPDGGLRVATAEKASLLGSQIDCKQCREQLVTPLSCFPQSRCNSLAFRTSVLLRLLLSSCVWIGVGVLILSVFFLYYFLKKVADIIAPMLQIIFFRLIRLGSFPEYWRSANVTACPSQVCCIP